MTITKQIKKYNELNNEELEVVNDKFENSKLDLYPKEDYEYILYYDDEGNLRSSSWIYEDPNVSKLEDRAPVKINSSGKTDVIDTMTILFGKKHSKTYQQVKKRMGLTNEQVNTARRIVKETGRY